MKQNNMDCIRAMEIFKIMFFGGLACAVVALLVGLVFEPIMYTLGWVGIIGVVGGLIFGYSKIRCPYCGAMLLIGRLPGVPRVCPECGEKLRDD